jgi:general secretion pathway protein F
MPETAAMLFSIAADERAALQFDDLASALDAGLPLANLGGDPAAGERAVHSALAGRGVHLDAAEDAVLVAAAQAGRLGAALRARAEQRRQRAAFAREVWGGLRYPLLLFAMAILTSLVVSRFVGGFWFPTLLIAGLGALGAALLWIRRGLAGGGERWRRLPWLGALAAELGELPYLEALHALYASGVPIVAAHATATDAVAVVDVRLRLRAVGKALREGIPLAGALAAAAALHPESRQLLATGEGTGQLEDALARALRRRREVCTERIRTLARWLGACLYGLAMAVVLLLVIRFWLGYADQLRRAMGR